ncbi:L-kynurenine hydrolase [Suhomyces tanzawaensis NRRL Y-17324]|uniref:Kynureninase n=1 Tax=Suhomyces tanzawaensis NRRL Y-17324 TaxID=984487 RepID=A0A1E4SN73_9ASCO|nr:L-kynurenine hydrolase [Suhomyces tanzawaensis NRRL Y-17324]ODV80971.1 L-kynurenine hydrolase [Suhomyces tanzawaensis NRRL Y-17324]
MTLEKARELDTKYPTYRDKFAVPTHKSLGIKESNELLIYFCGNSLGLMPHATKVAVNNELNAWAERGVESHFNHPNKDGTDWVDIDLPLLPLVAPVVGAKENEVAVMGSLTSNLNALLIHFYKPAGKRTKILFEKQAFPSDYYAFLNLVKFYGYDESHLIQLEVKPGNTFLQTSDILEAVDKHADELALVCFPGIQYYTGQLFKIEEITNHVKRLGDIVVGWDLAHAVGNVPLQLHDWNVDFAAWCSYKYLNSGPGAIAGIYVHERYTKDLSKNNYTPRLAGWWGNNSQDRFKMLELFDPINSALSYRQSNPSVIDVVAVRASLEMFKEVGGVETLRKKSLELTQFLQDLLTQSIHYLPQGSTDSRLGFKILTPFNPEERGSQLSILFQPHYEGKDNIMEKVNSYLHEHGIISDERRPDVIRLAPVPLYNTFEEEYIVATTLNAALDKVASNEI